MFDIIVAIDKLSLERIEMIKRRTQNCAVKESVRIVSLFSSFFL